MKYSYDEKCLDLARHFFPGQSISFLEALAQDFQDCVEGREDDADIRTLPIPDFLRNQDNLRAERAEKETRHVPDDRWIKHDSCEQCNGERYILSNTPNGDAYRVPCSACNAMGESPAPNR